MPGPESKYIKTLYQSFPNLIFVALLLLLSLVVSPAFYSSYWPASWAC